MGNSSPFRLDGPSLPAGALPAVKHRSGLWYTGLAGQSGLGVTLAAGREYPMPLRVERSFTIDRIAISVSTAVAATVHLGLRADDGNGHPGSLITNFGTVDSSTTGDKTLTVSQALVGGVQYHLVALAVGGGPTVRAIRSATVPYGAAVLADLTSASGLPTGRYTVAGNTTLGSSFPAWEFATQNMPLIAYRVV